MVISLVPTLLLPTRGGLVGDVVVVLVDGLRGLILGLADHGGDGGGVDVGEDAASHSLQGEREVAGPVPSPQLPPKTFTTPVSRLGVPG